MDDPNAPAHPQGSGLSVNEPTLSTGEIRALAGELAAASGGAIRCTGKGS